jgi:tetratricopeptide (TPR) repeat protein
LRQGEAVFKDEKSEGRTRSLGAALSYGFENAFTDAERKQLALLHLFQGFVDVNALKLMGNPEEEWHLPEVRGMDREPGIRLLDRAAEVGLLTAYGGGYYSIHPALPWFFKKMFHQYYADATTRAERAFLEALAALSNYYANQYVNGVTSVIGILSAEETNLLHARYLARSKGWWDALIGIMQGLGTLYDHTGRGAEWARLVEEIVPDFIDPVQGGPLPGREEEWSLVTQYRVRLARERRHWAEAERLQTQRIKWNRQRAAEALALPPEKLDSAQRNRIRSLAASLHELAEIQRGIGQLQCVETYNQSYELALRIQDKSGAAVVAFNIGKVYEDMPSLQNLDEAERWYRRSLELRPAGDQMGRAKSLAQTGSVDYQRFLDAKKVSRPAAELMAHLKSSLQRYLQALDLQPADAIHDLAAIHHQIGNIYRNAGDLERTLDHYRKSIGYEESTGNLFGSAQSRLAIAVALAEGGRFADAREYALAALRNYQTYGASAADQVQKTLTLIAIIEKAIKPESGDEN